MQQHVTYWSDLAAAGTAIAFGPVAAPQGAYGIAIVEAPDEAHVRDLTANDPVMKMSYGFRYDVDTMPQLVLRERAQ